MSVVICYLGDDFSIIATDTRGIKEGDNPSDSENKLYKHKFGWLGNTGAGHLGLAITNRINTTDIANLEDLKKVIIDSYQGMITLGYSRKKINGSGVALTWNNNTILIIDFEADKNCEFVYRELLKNRIFIFYPPEYNSTEKVIALQEKYDLDFKGDFLECLLQICRIFKEIASSSNTVSNICDIGALVNKTVYRERKKIDDMIFELKKHINA